MTPAYYKKAGHECRSLSADYPHPIACAIEYVWRHEGKGGVEDLHKALDWLEYAASRRLTVPIPDQYQARILADLESNPDIPAGERVFWISLDAGSLDGMILQVRSLIEDEQ